MTPRWFGAALDFGLAAASALGLPIGEAGKAAAAGYKLHEKLREKQQAASLNDRTLIARTQADILNGWLTQAQGDWLTEADAKAAGALLDRHLPDCLPSLAEMAGLAGTSDRAAATVALTLTKLAVKDAQFRDNQIIRRFAEDVLALIIREVAARPQFRSLLITHDIEAMARAQQHDRERDEAFQKRLEEKMDQLLAQSAQGQAAIREGIDPGVIVAIAARLNPDVSNSDQALLALDRAAAELLQLRAERDAGTNLGDLVDTAVRRIAARIDASDPDGAQAEGAKAFADWQQRKAEAARREAERRDAEQAAGIKLAQETERAAYLAGDAEGAARWIGEGLALAADAAEAPLAALENAQKLWWERGRDQGLNLDLAVAAAIARVVLHRTNLCPDDRGKWQNKLGIALGTLGDREVGTGQLELAAEAFEAALLEYSRVRAPLQWAMTQNNRGVVLNKLGERETGPEKLEQAIIAFKAALLERTRERVPLKWAMTQHNLGTALHTLGERESGTASLSLAVEAYKAALLERTRERVPLDWAMTQNNLGNTLATLGERESGRAQLKQAVRAYEAALLERTRNRVPLDWATTHNNLGNALRALGERQIGTVRLERAVHAFEAALLERTHERMPFGWAQTHKNLAIAELTFAKRTAGPKRRALLTAALERALAAREVFVQAGASHYVEKIGRVIADIEAERAR